MSRDYPERPLDPPDTSLEPWEEAELLDRETEEAESICESMSDFSDLVLLPAIDNTDLLSELALLCQTPVAGLSPRERRMRSALVTNLVRAARERVAA